MQWRDTRGRSTSDWANYFVRGSESCRMRTTKRPHVMQFAGLAVRKCCVFTGIRVNGGSTNPVKCFLITGFLHIVVARISMKTQHFRAARLEARMTCDIFAYYYYYYNYLLLLTTTSYYLLLLPPHDLLLITLSLSRSNKFLKYLVLTIILVVPAIGRWRQSPFLCKE